MIMQPTSPLAEHLRNLRLLKGVGLKSAAPALGVSYTYLSKIENAKAVPSDELIGRIAHYYGANRDELMLLAERVPPDIQTILRENPTEALEFLRRRFGASGSSRP